MRAANVPRVRVLRGFVAGVLLTAGLVLVPLGDLGVWTRRELLSTSGFARLSTQVLRVRDSNLIAIAPSQEPTGAPHKVSDVVT